MLVGAGLMFVLMHGEVSTEVESSRCDVINIDTYYRPYLKPETSNVFYYKYCKIRDLTCVERGSSLSCVKTKGEIFK